MKRLGKKACLWLLVLAMVLSIMPMAAAEGNAYEVTVTPSTTDVKAGDTVTLTAKVTNHGTEITDLEAAGLYLWWWTDVWAEGHTDGLSDATYSNYANNSGHSLTADVTLPSEGTYYIAAELKDSSSLTTTFTTFNVTAASAELTGIPLENGDFENGTTNWTLTEFSSVASEAAENNNTNTLTLWLSPSDNIFGSAAYTVTLTAGTYQFGFDLSGAASSSGLSYAVTAGSNTLASGSETYTTTGWDAWTTYSTSEFTLMEDTTVTFTLSGTVPAGYWGHLDNLTLQGTGSIVTEPDTSVSTKVDVQKVPGLSDDFIMGMDISSVVSEFKSGVTFQDFDGNTIDNVTDFCEFLAECGVTHIRVRVWNDPRDASGNGYGGGNNDINTAVEIAEGCSKAGLKMLVDFHCSDFWTDPGKQQAPKAWKSMNLEAKEAALASFLTNSLTAIKATGVEIAMVQVGNETTGGFIGETSVENMCTLFSAGSAAVRAFDSSIKVVIHVTNPESGKMTTWAKNLSDNNVDYDILATSYYPSWHGTLANLKSQLRAVQDTYGKEVMVAETSYAFTLDDTDGHDNTIREGTNDTMMCETQYPFSVQGQASYLRDLIAAVHEAGGLGVYYWEPAWITVGDITGLVGDAFTEQKAANVALWEKYGSGWASSYAAEYDSKDAGQWFGGSAVDNQAMFTADGTPLDSINVWKYVKTGAYTNTVTMDDLVNPTETITAGRSYNLPETVTVIYNKGTENEAVKWDEADIAAVDPNTPGVYVVHGTVTLKPEFEDTDYSGDDTASVTYTLTVKLPNLIDGEDWSFENGNTNFTGIDSGNKTDIAGSDFYDGSRCLHWSNWQNLDSFIGAVTYSRVLTLTPGTYTFEAVAQGAEGDTVTLKILDTEDHVLFTGTPAELKGWREWQTPSVSFDLTAQTQVKVQIEIRMAPDGWGTLDCLYLYCTHYHDWVEGVGAKLPTLLTPGYTGDVACSVCGEVLEEGDVIPPLGILTTPSVDKPNSPMAYTDVKPGDWFYDDVKYVYENGLMNGTGDNKFSPNATLTRGMIVTILYRMDGAPATRYNGMFSDVANYQWYTDAVEWAVKNGIVNGYGNGKFGPEDPVTREQLAAILFRYAQYQGMTAVTLAEHLIGFDDAESVSAYAVSALNWAVGQGLVNGSDGKLLPQSCATRAQVAAVIHRFLEG